MIELHNGTLRAVVLPEAGGGLARLDWLESSISESPLPLLRGLALPPSGIPLPGQLACFPLVPWSNRIAPDGFEFEGRRITPLPNREGEPCPIHGDGWQLPWQVESQEAQHVVLTLDRRASVPFSYTARMAYMLDGATLRVTLEAMNTGTAALPFGLGLHPWLPHPESARLLAAADAVWLSGADKLPSERVALPQAWDFSTSRALPSDGVDNVFSGWNGEALVEWPTRGVRLRISAHMGYYILYVPPGRDFFCLEPVDHSINAHNLPGGPVVNGLTVLPPGESLRRTISFKGELHA